MIFGLSLSEFTEVRIAISLLAIFAGLFTVLGMLHAKRREGWTILFLLASSVTSASGFLFASASFGPPHVIGALSLLTLAAAITARYGYHLVGAWRWTYVAGAVLALYLNVFVGIVQAFEKLPFLQSLAPTRSAPAFIATQLVVTLLFIGVGWRAAVRFYPEPAKMRRRRY